MIAVKNDLFWYNGQPLTAWQRNIGGGTQIADDARDVPSSNTFWVIQYVKAYEGAAELTNDPNGEGDVMLGASPQNSGIMVFVESIRDLWKWYTSPPVVVDPSQVSLDLAIARVVFHESLHKFRLFHADPILDVDNPDPGDQGILAQGSAFETDNLRDSITPQQARYVQSAAMPR